jgi:hypothetical protein
MKPAPPVHDVRESAGIIDDRLLFWLTQGLFFGITSIALLILKVAVLDQFV